ncbi:MAG: hypothetical protein NTZ10_05140 [Candidatus Saganbacteria bacterium]|nr:hypothetical protein [Candidatus Saganbacteria bacterium]
MGRSGVPVNDSTPLIVEHGLNEIIRWSNLQTAFKGKDIQIDHTDLVHLLSGTVHRSGWPDKIYKYNTVVESGAMKNLFRRFVTTGMTGQGWGLLLPGAILPEHFITLGTVGVRLYAEMIRQEIIDWNSVIRNFIQKEGAFQLNTETLSDEPQRFSDYLDYLKAIAYMKLSELQYGFPAFYKLGPFTDLELVRIADPERTAALAGLNVAAGNICFVIPRPDNLVGQYFTAVDTQENTLGVFAFDASERSCFSRYDYGDEEKRQFDLNNRKNMKRQIQPFLSRLAKFVSDYMTAAGDTGTRHKIVFNPIETEMMGPARSIELVIPNPWQKGKTLTCPITFLRLEKNKKCVLRAEIGTFPDSDVRTIVITLKIDGTKTERKYYFMGDNKKQHFSPVFNGKIDDRGRVRIPALFTPMPWDNHANKLVFTFPQS